ncbi:GAF domain-containing protein [Microbacterium sp. C5A9]|uniref:GAF domain-containing protein n=1 Tax=Microbacterium sp. C5A9 TaxID=2736663 RepID=UPI001F5261E2|nr:GAF domain-containing protein [Microbacterium sp. C5A9]
MSTVPRMSHDDDAPSVYRAPMRSRDDDVSDGPAVERALALGVCGVGGRLDGAPESLTDALTAVDAVHGERMARRLERFASVADGTFVWTRDAAGLFSLGRITGPWRYDGSADARDVDLVHVRACDWLGGPVEPAAVPPGVLEAFARGGRNWQSITRADAARLTAAVWTCRTGG